MGESVLGQFIDYGMVFVGGTDDGRKQGDYDAVRPGDLFIGDESLQLPRHWSVSGRIQMKTCASKGPTAKSISMKARLFAKPMFEQSPKVKGLSIQKERDSVA